MLKTRTEILTDSTDDGGAAVILFGCIFCVQARGPFQLGPVGQVVQRIAHLEAVVVSGGLEELAELKSKRCMRESGGDRVPSSGIVVSLRVKVRFVSVSLNKR